MSTEQTPKSLQYPDPSQPELWDSAAAAVERARQGLGQLPEITMGSERAIREAADHIPDSPGQHPDISTDEVRAVHAQVADSYFDAGRVPGRATASQPPAWATEPTGEKPAVDTTNTTPFGHTETLMYLDAEDLTTGRGSKPPHMPKHSSENGPGTNPWARGRGRFPTIQPPSL